MFGKNLMIFLILLIILNSCKNTSDPNYDSHFDLASLTDARGLIQIANDYKYTFPEIESYITQNEVIMIFPDGRKVTKQMPDSITYIAIAPYISTTHSCKNHYPSSCQGELIQKSIILNVEGNSQYEYKNVSISTMKNGFFEIWLPRNKIFKIKIIYQDKVGEETISTGNNDRTCITTTQLK